MGAIVGAGLISHVPPLVMPEAVRRELNNGEDTTLYQGLHELGAQRLRPLAADTVVVVDTHWFTTVEHIVTSHDRRGGLFTSEELPRGMCQMPYDMPGDRELAEAWAARPPPDDTCAYAIDDPHLPVQLSHHHSGRSAARRGLVRPASATAEPNDSLLFGELLAPAVAGLDRGYGLGQRRAEASVLAARGSPRPRGADRPLHLRTPEAQGRR